MARSAIRTRCSEWVAESGRRSIWERTHWLFFFGAAIAKRAKPRPRNHHSAPPKMPNTAKTASICWRYSIVISLVLLKVRETNTGGGLVHHDFPETDQRAADADVEVFAGGAVHANHAPPVEFQ